MPNGEFGPIYPMSELESRADQVGKFIICWDDVLCRWTIKETKQLLSRQNPPIEVLAKHVYTRFLSIQEAIDAEGWKSPEDKPYVSFTNRAAHSWKYLFKDGDRCWLGWHSELKTLVGTSALWKKVPYAPRELTEWERENLDGRFTNADDLPLGEEVFAFEIEQGHWVKLAFTSKEEFTERYWCWAEVIPPPEPDKGGRDNPDVGDERDGRILVAMGDDVIEYALPWMQDLLDRMQSILYTVEEYDLNLPGLDEDERSNHAHVILSERIGIDVESQEWTGMMISGSYQYCWVAVDDLEKVKGYGEALLAELEAQLDAVLPPEEEEKQEE